METKKEEEKNDTSPHVKMNQNVEELKVALSEDDKYQKDTWTRPAHLPWDELEMKEHGLVDKAGHHKNVPEDDVQLHREGKIDEHGHLVATTVSATQHIPFDEIAMKQSGYVDTECHHMTENELTLSTPVATTNKKERHVNVIEIITEPPSLISATFPKPESISKEIIIDETSSCDASDNDQPVQVDADLKKKLVSQSMLVGAVQKSKKNSRTLIKRRKGLMNLRVSVRGSFKLKEKKKKEKILE